MSLEPTLTLGTYKPTDGDFNRCHGQAIEALRHLANHPRPSGGNDTFNAEHLLQIAAELEHSFGAIHRAAQALAETAETVDDSAVLKALRAQWPDTLAAFRGAFDTPVARRRDDSEYAEDARARMRALDGILNPEPVMSPEEAIRVEAERLSRFTHLENLLHERVHSPRIG